MGSAVHRQDGDDYGEYNWPRDGRGHAGNIHAVRYNLWSAPDHHLPADGQTHHRGNTRHRAPARTPRVSWILCRCDPSGYRALLRGCASPCRRHDRRTPHSNSRNRERTVRCGDLSRHSHLGSRAYSPSSDRGSRIRAGGHQRRDRGQRWNRCATNDKIPEAARSRSRPSPLPKVGPRGPLSRPMNPIPSERQSGVLNGRRLNISLDEGSHRRIKPRHPMDN